ncbi:MAG: hypothetical protein KJ718_05835 [Nanoarchaeota archaeon]|nr:hypothetical protein [Nanoarchaeota archaeon]MBU1052043.1 hypothetical protein [Nanoarchaeota archaeon]MBU1988814.1 hypothetical protein [Nanoarchaeota archaeon]
MGGKIESVLRKLGLSEGEVKVYLALVEFDSVTVGPIIRKSRVSSSKVYDILDKLIQKCLVKYSIREKTKYFQAAQPVSLRDYVESKEDELTGIKSDLNEVIDKIKGLGGGLEKEEARIYKGYKGIRTGMFEAVGSIPAGGEYYFFSTGYGGDPYLKQFFRNLAEELRKRKIKIRGLANVKEKKLFRIYYEKIGYNMKYVGFSWPSDITIAGKYLIIFVWDKKEPVIYMIQSKPLVESYSSFFKEMWNKS